MSRGLKPTAPTPRLKTHQPPSKQQLRALEYIGKFYAQRGYMPPIKRVMRHCEFASQGTTQVSVRGLIRRGFLKRDAQDGWCSIQLTEAGIDAIGGRVNADGAYRRMLRSKRPHWFNKSAELTVGEEQS